MKLPADHANLFPYLMVEGAERLLAFVTDVFDAVELGRTERDGQLANVRVRIGDTGFMLSEASPMLGPVPAALYLFVDDADASHTRALAHGAEELYPPMDMPYGDRQGGVRDPFGNIWFISTRIVDGPYED